MATEKCSCPESLHLREALKNIAEIATSETGQTLVDDLAEVAGLAEQALYLVPLSKPWTTRTP